MVSFEVPGGEYLVSKQEKRWLAWFILLVITITTIPYVIGFASQGNQWRFSGFVFAVEDGNSYIAKMLSGSTGAWMFRSPYSAQDQGGVLMYLPYLMLGKLAAGQGMHEQLVSLYHLARLIAAALQIWATYSLVSWFIPEPMLRKLGVTLATLGGGLGWIGVLFGSFLKGENLPLEFYSPESFGFLSIFGMPHLAAARACMLVCLLVYLRLMSEPEKPEAIAKKTLLMACLWLAAALMQPLTAIIVGLVISAHVVLILISRRVAQRACSPIDVTTWVSRIWWVALAALPPAGYSIYLAAAVLGDPFLQAWSSQNVIRSPHPLQYLLAYGLLVPFAWVGARRILKRASWVVWLPVSWVIILPLLAYAPLNLQRRMVDGVWIAFIILSLAAFSRVYGEKPLAFESRARLYQLLFGLAFPSTILLLIGGWITPLKLSQPVFIPSGQAQAFEALDQLAAAGSVVLSAYETGNALPAWAPMRVLIGHGPESAGLDKLEAQVKAFFSLSASETYRQSFLCQEKVDFLFWGPEERSLGSWQPEQSRYLINVAVMNEYSIYQVDQVCP